LAESGPGGYFPRGSPDGSLTAVLTPVVVLIVRC
jgi:hypothetical protein